MKRNLIILFLLSLLSTVYAVPTVTWDETTPAGTDPISAGDDRLREMKQQVREIINKNHYMPSSGKGATWGDHTIIRLIPPITIAASTTSINTQGALFVSSVTGIMELYFIDNSSRVVRLTDNGYIYSVNISSFPSYVYFGACDYFASGSTFTHVAIVATSTSTSYNNGAYALFVDNDLTGGGGLVVDNESTANDFFAIKSRGMKGLNVVQDISGTEGYAIRAYRGADVTSSDYVIILENTNPSDANGVVKINQQGIGSGTSNYINLTPAVTRYYVVGYDEFKSTDVNNSTVLLDQSPLLADGIWSLNLNGATIGYSDHTYIAPVHLPDGVTITKMTMYFAKTNTASAIDTTLYVQPITTNTTPGAMALCNSPATTGATGGYVYTEDTSINTSFIDNNLNQYFIRLHVLPDTLYTKLYAVKITYIQDTLP